ncbi:hypothetical protein D915_008946 [Fasciola hepatica]|uniref:Uncharacterized protein n=1 Tax=Fasciola hepatica TaxID=6192 RepID=A0A4E0RTF8_FASHE|nr:hypothetical protein D915_008946 [Fasciola hepatica]
MNVEDLAKPGASESDTNQFADPGTTESVDVEDAVMIQDKTKHYNKLNRRLLGNILLDAFKASDTSRISQFASDVFQSCNPSMPIDPSKTEAETLSQCEALVHSHNSFGSSSNVLLSSAMVKVYLSKAQECWMRSQTTASTKCGQPALFASQIRVGFRYLIPSLVLLEHLIPDAYSNAFGSNILPEHPVCPYCGQPGMQFPDLKPRHAPSVDRRVLANFLRIASCLFSAAVVCYTDAVRQIDRADYMSKLRPHLQEQSDRIVLQTACSLGREQVTQMLEAVVCGPYFCKVVSL